MMNKMPRTRKNINWASPWRIAGMVLIVLGVIQLVWALILLALLWIPMWLSVMSLAKEIR